MELNRLFLHSTKIITSIVSFIDQEKNQEIVNSLKLSGGIISLIGIGIEIYKEIQKDLKTSEEKAFGSLISIAFVSAKIILEEIQSALTDYDIELKNIGNKKELIKKLFETFKDTSDWNNYLPDHPSVKKFRNILFQYLRSLDLSIDIINEFLIKFNLAIEKNVLTDKNIDLFYDWWTRQKNFDNLKEYLEHVKGNQYKIQTIDKKPIAEYYIELKCTIAEGYTWDWDDKKFEDRAKQNINTVIDEFLHNKKKYYMIIAAPFGIGKTSTMIMLASKYAEMYLQIRSDPLAQIAFQYTSNRYIPILVSLKDGLSNVYYQNDLDNLLKNIISPSNVGESSKREILLILDALDEIHSSIDINLLLNVTIPEYHKNYPNMKIIMTTRLKAELQNKFLNIKIDDHDNKYTRLLPFTKDQVNEFFLSYFTEEQRNDLNQKYKINQLTYEYILELLGLKKDGFEITKPLFTWMISLLFSDKNIKIEFGNEWDFLTKRSILYMFFIHHIINGKYKFDQNKWNESYFQEKKVLRCIAVLKFIYGNELYHTKLSDYLKSHFNVEMDLSILEGILTSYFHLPVSNQGKIVDFIHETFKEYLLAEYFLEILLNKTNTHRLNLGVPSEETIHFLDGLLKLFHIQDKLQIIKFIEPNKKNQITLLNSFDYKKGGIKEAKRDICESAIETMNRDLVVFKQTDPYADPISKDVIWYKVKISNTKNESLNLHKILCFRVILILSDKDNNEITKIKDKEISNIDHKLQIFLSDLVLDNLDFSRFLFENISFHNIIFSNFKFNSSRFGNVIFIECKFENCTIDKSIFYHSSFLNCEFINTNIDDNQYGIVYLEKGSEKPTNFLFTFFDGCIFQDSNIKSENENASFIVFIEKA